MDNQSILNKLPIDSSAMSRFASTFNKINAEVERKEKTGQIKVPQQQVIFNNEGDENSSVMSEVYIQPTTTYRQQQVQPTYYEEESDVDIYAEHLRQQSLPLKSEQLQPTRRVEISDDIRFKFANGQKVTEDIKKTKKPVYVDHEYQRKLENVVENVSYQQQKPITESLDKAVNKFLMENFFVKDNLKEILRETVSELVKETIKDILKNRKK